MSAAEDSVMCRPLCQGFLKKRKDKIRLKWVTYWFKLHNTTLLFYHKKHESFSELRGQYYLIEVESVREVTCTKKKDYIFEIAMKNGKRKVLAAETAALRQLWMSQLLQAMNHHVYETTELNSLYSMSSNSESDASDMLVKTHHSAEPNSYVCSPSMHSVSVIPTTNSPIYTDLDMSHEKSSQCAEDEGKQKATVTDLENDYDVLPLCKRLDSSEEGIYDTPASNRRASEKEQEADEGIYDIPKFACRQKSVNDNPCFKEPPEITGLLHDMVTCLGGNSAEWVTSQKTIYQT